MDFYAPSRAVLSHLLGPAAVSAPEWACSVDRLFLQLRALKLSDEMRLRNCCAFSLAHTLAQTQEYSCGYACAQRRFAFRNLPQSASVDEF